MRSPTVLAITTASAVLMLAACGSSSSSSPASSGSATPAATSGGSSAPQPSSSSGAGALVPEAQAVAAGDIPDNQVFLSFRDASAGYSMKYPEGWASAGRQRRDVPGRGPAGARPTQPSRLAPARWRRARDRIQVARRLTRSARMPARERARVARGAQLESTRDAEPGRVRPTRRGSRPSSRSRPPTAAERRGPSREAPGQGRRPCLSAAGRPPRTRRAAQPRR